MPISIDTKLNFEAALVELVTELRDEVNNLHDSYMEFIIEVSGNPAASLKIVHKFYNQEEANYIKGGDVKELLNEFLRRRGYQKNSSQLLLTASNDIKQEVDEDPIPF